MAVVNLALQGGGSHGAFTWGVLDTLLEDGRLEFEGITGASAGAMNAVMLAEGWRKGLADGTNPRMAAREKLKRFWTAVGDQPAWAARLPGADSRWVMFDLLSRVWSPYQLNPFNYNPLRELLEPLVDFEALRGASPFKLFVSATNVRTGRARVFRETELRLEMLLASAALPFAFHAVEVDGEHFWDGGYMGNPSLYPLFRPTRTRDLLLVQINPLVRDEVPDTAQEIIERVNEISFNSALLHELRAIEFVQRLIDEQRLDPVQHRRFYARVMRAVNLMQPRDEQTTPRYKRLYLHVIEAEDKLRTYGASSKNWASRGFLNELFELGRGAASGWLASHIEAVGRKSSVDIAERFL